eukprot:jgi/Mesvir1/2893/Mv13966-RA.1
MTVFRAREMYLQYLRQWQRSDITKVSKSVACDHDYRCTAPYLNGKGGIEFSPGYMVDRRAAWNMMVVLPHAHTMKLVVILRSPSQRAYSSFLRMVSEPERFLPLVRQEAAILKECYMSTMAIRDERSCRPGHRQLDLFQECVGAYVRKHKLKEPWFSWLSHQDNFPRAHCSSLCRALQVFAGMLLPGLYADALKNFLCAGFRPDQITIITTGELAEDPLQVLARVSWFVGKPLTPAEEQALAKMPSIGGGVIFWGGKGGPPRRRGAGGRSLSGFFGSGGKRGGAAPANPRKMPKEVQSFLDNFYKEPNRELLRLLASHAFDFDEQYVRAEFGD